MRYNENHYTVFSRSLYKQEGWVGNDLQKWWNHVTCNEKTNLPSKRITRQGLKELCGDKSFTDKECLGAVMAWGGQNRIHGQTLFARFNEVQPIISDMRNGRLDHIMAYRNFYEVWKKEEPLGMGAAYFTKLIFFCEPSHQGFIMDQWTSKSTNLLCDSGVVHLTQGHVSKKNDTQTYAQFCGVVCDIAGRLQVSPESVEMAMFSAGGRKKEEWRRYVIKNYTPSAVQPR